jgi:hypothetical protein
MVKRSEEGVLEPTERFITEFETALERFTKMAETLENLGEPYIAPVEEILHLNNTVYIVRMRGGRYRSLDNSIGKERRDFNNAYVILRPLLQSLVAAYKNGLLFQFTPGSVAANSYDQLMLDAMFSWEVNHRDTITELMKVFYRLITGAEYNPSIAENPTIENMGLPPRLTAVFKEVLTGEPSYGSVDDFSKHLRTVMDTEGNKEIISERLPDYASGSNLPVRQKKVKKGAAAAVLAGVAIVIFLLIGGPLTWMFINNIGGMRDYVYYIIDAYEDYPLEEPMPAAPAAFVRLHTAYAITDPNDPTVMLNGSFHESGGIVFKSAYQNGFGLARLIGGNIDMVAEGVRPAFITSHGDYIYFSDGLADYNIRRVRTDGSGLETVSNHTASFLTLHGSSLFYTNHSNRDFIYRMDLSSLESLPFIRLAAYETVVHGGQLFFVNGSGGFRIYAVSADSAEAQPIRVNQANSDNLRVEGGHIFYRNVENGIINRISLQGNPLPVTIPLAAASFDISGSTMAIVEEAAGELWFYDLTTQIMEPTANFASYAALLGDTAYIIDRLDSRITRTVNFVPPQLEENGEDAEEYEEDEEAHEEVTEEYEEVHEEIEEE